MFGALALSNQDHFRPEGFWRAFKDYDGEPINVREHQDAYEFFTRLQARTRALSATTRPCALYLRSLRLMLASISRSRYWSRCAVHLASNRRVRPQSMLCERNENMS